MDSARNSSTNTDFAACFAPDNAGARLDPRSSTNRSFMRIVPGVPGDITPSTAGLNHGGEAASPGGLPNLPGSPGSPGSSSSPHQRHHPLRLPLRNPLEPLFPGGQVRSISLPQALHSFTLAGRNTSPKSAAGSSSRAVGEDSSARFGSTNVSAVGVGIGTSRAPGVDEIETGPVSSSELSPPRTGTSAGTDIVAGPVSLPKHRAVSEGRNGFLRPVGRSETTPHLSGLMCGEADFLDITSSAENVAAESSAVHMNAHAAMELEHGFTYKLDPGAGPATSFSEAKPCPAMHRALNMPDILRMIFEALDNQTVIPHELVQQRRKPLSLRHAQLMFGNTKRAVDAWEKARPTTTVESAGAGLYNCLFVNSLWHDVAVRVLEQRIHFRNAEDWVHFARRGAHSLARKPQMLVLHKLNDALQVELEMLDSARLGEQLEWLEFYTCPGLAPTPALLGPRLIKIVLPGCSRVNDRTMAQIAESCPQLEYLDLRACELVTDKGIKIIAKYCPKLQLLNVGRTHGGEFITYKGVKHLARQTEINTLGLAGCHIDDRAVWELALNRGRHLQRLSLNNCRLLTDGSIPRVLGYMPNLTVLEIRGCVQITQMRPLALFKAYREKQGQPPLIEGCEVIERRLQFAIMRLQREMSHRIVADCQLWLDQEDDE